MVVTLFVSGAILPAQAAPLKSLAAWQPLNQTPGDIKLQRTKTVVLNGIDGAINGLKAADKGVDRSKLTAVQKAGLRAQIEANVTWLEGKKQEVQSARDTATVLQYAKQASEHWKEAYPGLKKETGLMSCDNLEAELGKARNASAIASSKIASLKSQGKDTGGLESALALYNGHVDSASQYVASARSDFNGISAPNDGNFAKGLKQLSSAEKEMRGAYADLKTIYGLLLNNGAKNT